MVTVFEFEINPSLIYTTLISTTIAVVIIYLHKSKYKLWKEQGVKGPKQWPIIGNIGEILFSKSMLDGMDSRHKKYGPVYGMYMLFTPQLVVGDPEMLKDILVRDWHVFADRMKGRKSGDEVTDNFLTALSGNEWKRMRSVMSPTFTSGKMKSMFPVMQDCCKLMANNIRDRIRKQEGSGIYELDMRYLAGCYSIDVIAKCCFATDTNSFNDPDQVFVTYARKFFDVSKTRLFFAVLLFLMPLWFRKLVGFKGTQKESTEFFINVSKTILEQRRRDSHSNDQLNGTNDYLQLLIEASKDHKNGNSRTGTEETVHDHESHHGYENENGKVSHTLATSELKRPLTDIEIIASSVLFLAVGYDTTGSLITMAIYLLTCNQGPQSKLYEELKRAHDENGGKFSYEIISGLKYLDAVISETLRLLPPAALAERRNTEDYTFKKNGIFVSKGGSIILPIWTLHHDPNYWPEPEKFDPERFMPENRNKIVPYSYLPFGAGPRNCVGMRFALLESKLAIANLIIDFKFTPCSKTDVPLDLSPTLGLLNPKRVFVGVEER